MADVVGRLAVALSDRYVIERELGAGGMATVYLAHDVRHDRKVALKVLRPELAAILGGARFLAEIKTTANLQHPHILSLFDSGEADGTVFYVMPYVDGESLRDRLNRDKQLPVDEAVRIAREVADALEYAHQHGIVHRDIKPENILLHGGHALVADFGIALAASRSDGGTRMTETGMSLGTPHYMAPEQAMGEKEITPKADIYALGCVLYEMLTAEPPFVGATAQAIIARVMTEEPRSLTLQRRTIPPHVEAVVRTALQKLPADRFASAADFAASLGNAGFASATAAPAAMAAAAGRHPVGRRLLAAAPWLLFLAAAGAGAWGWLRPSPPPAVRRERVQIGSPGLEPGAVAWGGAIAPDGNTVVFVDSIGAGPMQLWAKERGSLDAAPLTGTTGARGPVFSPDGQWIAFVADGKLKKVPRLGGSAITIAESANGGVPAIAWLEGGTIVFNNPAFSLMRVSQDGGPVRRVHDVVSGRGIVSATGLPGGRGVLVGACSLGCPQLDLRVIDLRGDSASARVLTDEVYKAWYTPLGQVVFVRRDGGVFAAPFDLDSLAFAAPPVPVFDGVRTLLGGADMVLGADGTILYARGSAVSGGTTIEHVWVSRRGAITRLDSAFSFQPSANYGFALAPDGRRLAVSVRTGASEDIWIRELPAGPSTRLTFDGTNQRPRWTPDGRAVTYVARRDTGNADIRMRRADGTGEELTLVDLRTRAVFAIERTPDTTRFIVRLGNPPTRDIHLWTRGADSSVPLIATDRFEEVAPALSPNGRWLAYVSDESGRNEVYVRPFPDVNAGRWQVSRNGGTEPVWAHSGRELFYRNGSGAVVAVPLRPGSAFAMDEQRVLFAATGYLSDFSYPVYAVAPDDSRFLFARYVGSGPEAAPATLVLVQNWYAELAAVTRSARSR